MTHLVLFACPGMPEPSVVAQYEQALAPLGSVRLCWIAKPGFSSVFTQIGHDCRDPSGRVLPRLLQRYAPNVPHHTVSLVTYSAGYGLARELLRDKRDREALDAYVALDSIHGPKTATDAASAPFVEYARAAAAGQCLFALAHTDVPTPYMSTTEMAGYLSEQVPPDGHWWTRAYDTAPPDKPKREHGNALVSWGAGFVGEALVPYLATLVERPSQTALGPLGERLVAWYILEKQAGTCEEPPGSNTGERIRQFHAIAQRDGRRLGLTRGPWCASMLSYGLSRLDGCPEWFVPRCSGYELEQDAKAAGAWRDKPEAPGDICIMGRGTAGSWQRHVCVVTDVPDDSGEFATIGGNERDEVRITGRNLADGAVRGFIVLPRPGAVEQVCTALVDSAEKVARALEKLGELYG